MRPNPRELLMWATLVFLAGCLQLIAPTVARAERIKDLATVQGVRSNPLLGYGLVVGLDGTGDQTTQTPFTTQSLTTMLSQLGVTLPPGSSLQLKNVAAVMVTGTLPAFARPGQNIDVTISSLGNAKSLRGGTLLMTPLKGADGQVYAIAQGNVLVGGVGASANNSSVQVNHLSVGRISGGATVERAVPAMLGQGRHITLGVNTTDFTTTQRMIDAINREFGDTIAAAVDGRTIQVEAPGDASQRVAFLARLESVDVTPGLSAARVIVNARTGSVVMTQAVTLDDSAVAHGNLSVVINTEPVVSQPGALSRGQTVVTERSHIEIKQDRGSLTPVKGANLAEVIRALNAIGATPQDLLVILQALKAAGALRAELEII